MIMNAERVVVVRNLVSAYANRVQHEVIDRLIDSGLTKGQLIEFWTPSADADETIEKLTKIIQPGDQILVTAGDGTANMGANAFLQANNEGVRIGFLSFGNFSDTAATFTDHKAQRDAIKLLASTRSVDVRPLQVIKNGEHYRYALLYANLGWTAQAAAMYDDPNIRKDLQYGETNLAANLFRLAKTYFKTRSTAELPDFHLNDDEKSHSNITDILAINGPIMGRIIRTGKIYYEEETFFSSELDVSKFIPNIPFLGRSALNVVLNSQIKLPGSEVTHLDLSFDNNPNIPMQIDGEYNFSKINKLSITKEGNNYQTVKVIFTR
jgi:diacylglycerol kinase family enzyme